MASVGFWDPSMSAPPTSNLGAGRTTKKEKRWATPTGLRAGQSARMPEDARKRPRLTPTYTRPRENLFLSASRASWNSRLIVVAALDTMALSLHQSASDRSSTASPTNHGPIGSSHGRTPTLLDDRGAESAHRLALNVVICCVAPGPGTRRHDKSLRIFLQCS